MTAAELIDAFSDAIAYAEGFYVAGSRPARNNNPGDLTQALGAGAVVGMDGPFVVYASAADGWADLKLQVQKMLDGTSRYYNASMSILEIAERYTATQAAEWAANVAGRLGVSVDSTLNALIGDLAPAAAVGSGAVVVLLLAGLWLYRKGKK